MGRPQRRFPAQRAVFLPGGFRRWSRGPMGPAPGRAAPCGVFRGNRPARWPGGSPPLRPPLSEGNDHELRQQHPHGPAGCPPLSPRPPRALRQRRHRRQRHPGRGLRQRDRRVPGGPGGAGPGAAGVPRGDDGVECLVRRGPQAGQRVRQERPRLRGGLGRPHKGLRNGADLPAEQGLAHAGARGPDQRPSRPHPRRRRERDLGRQRRGPDLRAPTPDPPRRRHRHRLGELGSTPAAAPSSTTPCPRARWRRSTTSRPSAAAARAAGASPPAFASSPAAARRGPI